MVEWPNVPPRGSLLLLMVAAVSPWLLLAVAAGPAVVAGVTDASRSWYMWVSIPALYLALGAFLVGLWRIWRFPRNVLSWVGLALMWGNFALFVKVSGHG
jgi:hypothetical protein